MVGNFPDGLTMLCKGLSTASSHEVPNFNGTISTSSCEKISLGVELYSANPVDVTLTTHDKITIGDRPEFPGGVITACRHDVFLWVVTERGHSHEVPLEGLVQGKMGASWFKCIV